MIRIEVKDGKCSFTGEGKGVNMVMECLVIAASMSQHLASHSTVLADLYEYLLTKEVKSGTLFDESNRATASEIFKGTLEEFLKGEE